jgi:preprotein translocase SecE subunit
MAKTRAQRKAERRRREQQAQRQREGGDGAKERADEARAQQNTQAPISGEVAETEAVMETGAQTDEYGEHVVDQQGPDASRGAAVPGVTPEPVAPEPPAPSRADVGRPEAPAEPTESRRERKAREKEERRKARARELQKGQAEKAEKRRRPVTGFIASCWAELKKVQWPDRDTLVQASAVTIIFVAVMAAYLGALDAAFNFVIKQII